MAAAAEASAAPQSGGESESEEIPTDDGGDAEERPPTHAGAATAAAAANEADCAKEARAAVEKLGPLVDWPFELCFALLAAGYRESLNWSVEDHRELRAAFDTCAEVHDGLRAADACAEQRGLAQKLERQLSIAPPPSGRVLLYEARVRRGGEVVAKPVVHHGRTIAHEKLGAQNLLRVRFEPLDGDKDDPHAQAQAQKMQLAVLARGFHLAGRAYRLFAHKDDSSWFVAVGGRWRTAEAARSALADFGAISSVFKFVARPALALSQTHGITDELRRHGAARVEVLQLGESSFAQLAALAPPPEGVLRVVEVEDARGRDENGAVTLDAAGKERLMEDGCGLVSADIAALIPRVASGQLDRSREAAELASDSVGPMVSQVRLWYCGSLAKGTLLRCEALPPWTLVVRASQRKVNGRNGCAARDFWALEVVQTSDSTRPCRTSSQLVPLLEELGGAAAAERLLQLAKEDRARALQLATPDPNWKLVKEFSQRNYPTRGHEHESRAEHVVDEADMMFAGWHPRDEPYLARQIRSLMADRIKKLRLGAVTLRQEKTDVSAYLVGVADPTRTLLPGTVVVVIGGKFESRKEALLYRSPGIHPGDVRKAHLVLPTTELEMALGQRVGARANAVIFSTLGERSLADEMAGGDLDGDCFSVIWDPALVKACQCVEASLEAEVQALLPEQGAAPPELEADELKRERQVADVVQRVRLGAKDIGVTANQWLRVAETEGASSEAARKLACAYALALDAAKTGKRPKPERLCLQQQLPPHLRDHKGNLRHYQHAPMPGKTALARLHALDATIPGLPSVRAKDLNLVKLIPPDFRPPNGPRIAEFYELDNKWDEAYLKYREAAGKLSDDNGKGGAASEGYAALYERYRDELLREATCEATCEADWMAPQLNSKLLAEVAIIYAVTYKHRAPGGREYEPTGDFAWRVAGDYLCWLKNLLEEHEEKTKAIEGAGKPRKGCILPISRKAKRDYFAIRHRIAPVSESQED